MRLTADGERRVAAYEEPRDGLVGFVKAGDTLFEGTLADKKLRGRAYVFKTGCSPAAYDVEGNVNADETSFVLSGNAPVFAKRGCEIARTTRSSSNATLRFARIESVVTAKVQPKAVAVPLPEPEKPAPPAQLEPKPTAESKPPAATAEQIVTIADQTYTLAVPKDFQLKDRTASLIVFRDGLRSIVVAASDAATPPTDANYQKQKAVLKSAPFIDERDERSYTVFGEYGWLTFKHAAQRAKCAGAKCRVSFEVTGPLDQRDEIADIGRALLASLQRDVADDTNAITAKHKVR